MMKMGWILGMLICLVACEKTITISPDEKESRLVVEAQIENGQPPIVSLSSSLNYFSEIDSATLANSFVHGAKVSVTTANTTYPLTESSVSQAGNTAYFYSTPQVILSGIPGASYTLTIETGGRKYTANTTIPPLAKKVDSLWWKKAPFADDSTEVILMARITDPPGLGNYIRYFTRVNRGVFLPGFNSVFDDQIIDGKTYEIEIAKGVSKNEVQNRRDDRNFKRGDTVVFKHCNIDKASYDFWRTWEFGYQSIGNPFSSPGKVTGNISNGALGSFCGYGAEYKTLIIPK